MQKKVYILGIAELIGYLAIARICNTAKLFSEDAFDYYSQTTGMIGIFLALTIIDYAGIILMNKNEKGIIVNLVVQLILLLIVVIGLYAPFFLTQLFFLSVFSRYFALNSMVMTGVCICSLISKKKNKIE